jgi:hypothetical protein
MLEPKQEDTAVDFPSVVAQYDIESAKALVTAFENGLNQPLMTCGYHGTSIDAVELALRAGLWPGGRRHPGDLYFFPRMEAFPQHQQFGTFDEKHALESARVYAEWNVSINFILRELKADMIDQTWWSAANALLQEPNDPEGLSPEASLLWTRISTREGVRLWHRANREAKNSGIILALSREATAHFSVLPGYQPEGEMFLRVGTGMPLGFICGLEPIGQKDYEFFEGLQSALAFFMVPANSHIFQPL